MSADSMNPDDTDLDTGSQAPATQDTPQDSAPETSQDSQPQAPVEGTPASAAQPDRSSANPETTQQQPQATAPQPTQDVDWQGRYKHLQSHADRQLAEYRQRLAAAEREAVEHRARQEQAEKNKAIPRWRKAHPEHQKFSSVLERARTVQKQMQAIDPSLPPEQQQKLRETIASALTPDEQQEIAEYQTSVQEFNRNWMSDPEGTLREMVAPLMQQEIARVRQDAIAEASVKRDFADPELKPIIEEHAAELRKMLEDGVPYKYAIHTLKLHHAYSALAAGQRATTTVASTAAEQTRQRQPAAARTSRPDPQPRASGDSQYQLAVKEAKQLGIPTDDHRFVKILAKYEQRS